MLYKYRSLENFKYFMDIITNQRLYTSNYKDLNDPMEGQYLYSPHLNKKIIDSIWNEKQKTRILSLSQNGDMQLMWSHYANGHRGVVIGVEIDKSIYEVKPITYSESLFQIENEVNYLPYVTAMEILSQKHKLWEYEEEVRVFLNDGTHYVNVSVKEVIIGSKMSNQDISLVKKIIETLDQDIIISRENIKDYY